jgi:hypothetical protein
MKANKLPDKPSELLMLAMTDLEIIEKNPKYIISMSNWHDPFEAKCSVCHAGAVMANSLKVPINECVSPNTSDFSDDNNIKLQAIDGFRRGVFAGTLHMLASADNLPYFYRDDDNEWSISDLSKLEDRTQYKEHICTIIGILQAEGL